MDEFSSLVNLRGRSGSFPAGAVVLILLGVVLLLNTLDILQFRYIARYWPVLLILVGVYMLYLRFAPPGEGDDRRLVGCVDPFRGHLGSAPGRVVGYGQADVEPEAVDLVA